MIPLDQFIYLVQNSALKQTFASSSGQTEAPIHAPRTKASVKLVLPSKSHGQKEGRGGFRAWRFSIALGTRYKRAGGERQEDLNVDLSSQISIQARNCENRIMSALCSSPTALRGRV